MRNGRAPKRRPPARPGLLAPRSGPRAGRLPPDPERYRKVFGDARVAAIVTATDEELPLRRLLRELARLPLAEVLLVVNGGTPATVEIARNCPQARVLLFEERLGHDVGRAVGAQAADADVLLFLDADLPILAEDLLPFISAVRRGADIALNEVNAYVPSFRLQDEVTRAKTFLNRCLGRGDLGADSLTAVPHAMTREAVAAIGVEALCVPPKAQVLAALSGLRIQAGGSVNVFRLNARRRNNIGQGNPVAELILGDHAEALSVLLASKGPRLGYPDTLRNRSVLGGDPACG